MAVLNYQRVCFFRCQVTLSWKPMGISFQLKHWRIRTEFFDSRGLRQNWCIDASCIFSMWFSESHASCQPSWLVNLLTVEGRWQLNVAIPRPRGHLGAQGRRRIHCSLRLLVGFRAELGLKCWQKSYVDRNLMLTEILGANEANMIDISRT